jgi:hypothetical protein
MDSDCFTRKVTALKRNRSLIVQKPYTPSSGKIILFLLSCQMPKLTPYAPFLASFLPILLLFYPFTFIFSFIFCLFSLFLHIFLFCVFLLFIFFLQMATAYSTHPPRGRYFPIYTPLNRWIKWEEGNG